MDRRAILDRLDDERRHLAHDGTVIEVLPNVTRIRATDGSHHGVIHASLTPATADAVIAGEVAHHRALGVAFEWKLYAHDTPADLRDRLSRHGFHIGPHEAVLVCDVREPPPWLIGEGADQDGGDAPFFVRRGDDEAIIADHRRVAEAVWNKDFTFTTNQLLDALRAGSTQHRCFVAYDRATGQPAGIGRLYTHPASAFGGLYGGATLPAFRGRGAYRATVAGRAHDARALGAQYLIVDALPTSRPILERLGFVHLADTWPCEWRLG